MGPKIATPDRGFPHRLTRNALLLRPAIDTTAVRPVFSVLETIEEALSAYYLRLLTFLGFLPQELNMCRVTRTRHAKRVLVLAYQARNDY